MRQNPCRYCPNSYTNDRGIHHPSPFGPCNDCKCLKEHQEYLKKHRKFDEGEPITNLAELLEQEWVIWYHSTKHIEVIKNTQLSTVLRWLANGALHKAIKKESEMEA